MKMQQAEEIQENWKVGIDILYILDNFKLLFIY